MRLAACFLVRAEGGSRLARPYSCLIELRSLPLTPPALQRRCPISGAVRGPPAPRCSEQTLDIVTGPQGSVIPLSNLISLLCLCLSLLQLCFPVSRVFSAATTLSLCTPKKIL